MNIQVAFTEGALVKKGDLLFQIDPRPFQAEVRRLEAQLQQTRAAALDRPRYTGVVAPSA